MMRWRKFLAFLLGFLLVLPLVWAIHVAMFGGLHLTPGAKVAPMLAPSERQGLMTYERACGGHRDCEPPLGCFFNTRSRWMYCTDSRCMTDQQCSEEMACLTQKTQGGGPPIRYCTLVGLRKEGEACAEMPPSQAYACQRGLFCQEGRCGRPCQLDSPESCPEGFFCREGLNGPSCLPTCEGRACPDGQECVRLEMGMSVCAEVHGQNCQRTPCSPGAHKCSVWDPPDHPSEVWMTCLIRCGEKNTPSCPEGFVCEMNYCRKSCDPAVPNACGPHYKCYRYSERYAWTCDPDL
jgi:hypothetical protein